jgi:diguanylate cyclase (GGDEF)-like protein
MPEAPLSPREAERLRAVHRLGLLGTPAEERFDRITRMAKHMFGVPMAVIDIVGEKLAWLKSAQGMDAVDGERCDSYCAYTVLDDEVMIVRDSSCDPRVHDSAFATTWVFYAGVPLRFEGEHVGVLCIGDTQPRDLDADELVLLRDLAAMAEQELTINKLSETQIALARSNKELEMKANVDVLTRIWNRRAILEIAETEYGNLRSRPVAVLLIDLDHFKKINDAYGHSAGDEVLRVTGERLRACVRPADAVGRYGGEEFIVVMTSAHRDDVAAVAERIRASASNEPIWFDGNSISWTCSVGYTIGTTDDPLDTLINCADQALYQAKSNGRNRIASKALPERPVA